MEEALNIIDTLIGISNFREVLLRLKCTSIILKKEPQSVSL